MKITLPHNWEAREYQRPLWDYLAAGGKRAVVAWHRRSGKDAVMLHHVACSAFERIGNYWYMLPQYGQARKALWDAVNPHTGAKRLEEAFPKEIRRQTYEQEMKIALPNGSTFQVIGSDNFDSLVGSTPIGLVFSEYALSNPSAWGFLRPILLENGGWACFNSTPRGKNHFKALFDLSKTESGWFSQLLTAQDTGIFTPEQLASELREMQAEHGDEYGKALWLQEYFCSFDAAQPGAIWADCIVKAEAEGRIGEVKHEPGFPVFTGWDLGFDDDTAVWFYQVIGAEIRVIDYFDDRLKDIEYYANMLKSKAKVHGYQYGTHYLPHDARPRTLAAGGKSILQQLIDCDVGRFVIAPRLDVEEGIQAARATFPKCWFDRKATEKGRDYLVGYRRTWDDEKRVFSTSPLHDFCSHAADAWRCVSTTWRRAKAESREIGPMEKLMAGNVHALNFGQIKGAHLRRMRAAREDM